MRRYLATAASLTLAATLAACGSKDRAHQKTQRLWGRERRASEVEQRAKETIDPFAVENDEKVRRRVLDMDFDEVVARLGFVEYKGIARFELVSPARTLSVVEDTTIQHGLNGSFRVLQLDADGDPTREVIYDNGVMYVRNGGGQMRVQGIVKEQHIQVREEAWQPLRTFTAFYGPRCGLKNQGTTTAGGRSGARYTLSLLPGPEKITVPGIEGAKRPISLSGEIVIDHDTGVPLRANLKGTLEVPTERGDAAQLNLALNYTLRPIEGVEIKPKSFIPTIKRRPSDLTPLAFLEGGTHTSTVIGGKPSAKTRAPAGDSPSTTKRSRP